MATRHTQDGCPNDFTDHATPCGGTTTIGSPLTLAPDPRGFGVGSPMQALQQTAPGTTAAVSAPGILTRWRLRVDTAAGDTVLQVLRPDAGGPSYTVVAQSDPVHVTSNGRRLGAGPDRGAGGRSPGGAVGERRPRHVATTPATRSPRHQPPATAAGQSFLAGGTSIDRRLLVQADVEPMPTATARATCRRTAPTSS